jgi:hypothetical protein
MVGAEAFSVGADVAFARGKYRPGTVDGRRLLAHELAHVVQTPTHSSRDLVIRRKPTSRQEAPIPRQVTTAFDENANRWIVSVGGIPVAEVAVENKQTSLEINVQVSGNNVHVTVRHYGGAALAPAVNADVTPAFTTTFTEIDAREGRPGQPGPAAPPMPGQSAPGEVELLLGPVSMIPRRVSAGGSSREEGPLADITPTSLSDFEEGLAGNSGLVNAVVLDPEDKSAIIGYRVPATTGLTRLVDREGNEVFVHEMMLKLLAGAL